MSRVLVCVPLLSKGSVHAQVSGSLTWGILVHAGGLGLTHPFPPFRTLAMLSMFPPRQLDPPFPPRYFYSPTKLHSNTSHTHLSSGGTVFQSVQAEGQLFLPETQPSVWFPIADLTNYHKLNGLDNTNLLSHSSADQKTDVGLTGLKSGCLQAVSSWTL